MASTSRVRSAPLDGATVAHASREIVRAKSHRAFGLAPRGQAGGVKECQFAMIMADARQVKHPVNRRVRDGHATVGTAERGRARTEVRAEQGADIVGK